MEPFTNDMWVVSLIKEMTLGWAEWKKMIHVADPKTLGWMYIWYWCWGSRHDYSHGKKNDDSRL